MNTASDVSNTHLFESVALKESFKQVTGPEFRVTSTSQLLQSKQYEAIESYKLVFASQIPQLLPTFFLITWAIAVLLFLRFSPHRSKQIKYRVREQIPCTTCRFLTNNPYLRCAVQPNAALTQRAIDCSDYQL